MKHGGGRGLDGFLQAQQLRMLQFCGVVGAAVDPIEQRANHPHNT
jgi:hypothetical protein